MHRLWLFALTALGLAIWWLFFQAVFVLVLMAAALAAVWIWWEIYALRKAMRTPPGR